MEFRKLSWRDRMLLVNSVLFCVVGLALTARYLMGQAPLLAALLGMALLVFGAYRLALAGRGMRKRAGGDGHK